MIIMIIITIVIKTMVVRINKVVHPFYIVYFDLRNDLKMTMAVSFHIILFIALTVD